MPPARRAHRAPLVLRGQLALRVLLAPLVRPVRTVHLVQLGLQVPLVRRVRTVQRVRQDQRAPLEIPAARKVRPAQPVHLDRKDRKDRKVQRVLQASKDIRSRATEMRQVKSA